jgi:hypothetical protein
MAYILELLARLDLDHCFLGELYEAARRRALTNQGLMYLLDKVSSPYRGTGLITDSLGGWKQTVILRDG